jgi:hypothetical protein
MTNIDDRIREALRAEDREMMDQLDPDPSMFTLVFDVFRGRNRLIMMVTAFWTFVFFVLGILSVVRFFNAETTRDMLMWTLATVFCISAVAMMKIMWWLEMNKNAVTREVKRLELQIASLAARLKA